MLGITSLSLNGSIIGLRFQTPKGVFDADRESLNKHGIYNLRRPNVEELHSYGDLLMTQEEFQTGLVTEDISDSPKLEKLVSMLKSNQGYQDMFKILLPHEQSLEDFLNSGWQVERVHRNDEYNGQHYLYLPNGFKYRGGWIGKGRDPYKVLTTFHYEQCYWYMHQGGVCSPSALRAHPDLAQYERILRDMVSHITHYERDGKVTLEVPQTTGESIILDGVDYIHLNPYEQRGYFTNIDYNAINYNPNKFEKPTPREKCGFTFDLRELTRVAYQRYLLTLFGRKPRQNQFEPLPSQLKANKQ